MKDAPIPEDDEQRLRSLRSLHVLDLPETERFDRFTRIARLVFDVPIALVSFVDKDRQFFASFVGIDERETPRRVSFCGHAIMSDETMVVEDATADPRFADNPLVVGEPGVRFYAGHPIRDREGYRLGTLCIIDHQPRKLTDEQLIAIRDLASMVEADLATTQMALEDELTGIGNRRAFLWLGQNTLDNCDRSGRDATILYFDLDGLKVLNDREGHDAGDELICTFAAGLKACKRKSDVLGRLGGDEFAVLLSGSTEEEANRYLEALSRQFGDGPAPTYSVGRAERKAGDSVDLEQLLEQADAAMYEHKRRRKRRS